MKQLSLTLALVSFNLVVMSAAAIQETLISTQDNIRVEHWRRDYRDLPTALTSAIVKRVGEHEWFG